MTQLSLRTRKLGRTVALCLAGTLLPTFLSGCYHSTTAEGAVVVRSRPTMVWISPGIWVMEDYDEPVYFADGYYWYLSEGLWYRSPRWDSDFERFPPARVPKRIRALPQQRYRHFHGKRDWPRYRPDAGEQPPARPPRRRSDGGYTSKERHHEFRESGGEERRGAGHERHGGHHDGEHHDGERGERHRR